MGHGYIRALQQQSYHFSQAIQWSAIFKLLNPSFVSKEIKAFGAQKHYPGKLVTARTPGLYCGGRLPEISRQDGQYPTQYRLATS